MNPSYFRIRSPLDSAITRVRAWAVQTDIIAPTACDISEAVNLACDENGNWRGAALFVSEMDGWTTFQDLSGGFAYIPADDWLGLARGDELLVAGYNDSIPYGELISIRESRIEREFRDSPEEPETNANVGRLACEAVEPIKSWIEVASLVDDDPLGFAEFGSLWVFKFKPSTGMRL